MNELSYLYSLQHFGIKLGLSNIRELCSLLGQPQDKINSVHIGGTNGKGSTAAAVSAILQKAGYKTALYTSPHLIDFNERIRINNVPISQERLYALIRHIRGKIKDKNTPPTFFEFSTALALLYFAEESVDIAVMEVGMGGRLDATNIINPLVSVITNIGYDHMEYLGKSLEDIALEKCGIIKKGVPVISAEASQDILSVMEEKAEEAGSPLYFYGKDFYSAAIEIGRSGSRFLYSGRNYRGLELKTMLPGRHQIYNISTAVYAVELLAERGYALNEAHVRDGVYDVAWPGRLEIIEWERRILLDGAHNHSASIILREYIEEVLKADRNIKKIVLIYGALKDKDAGSILKELMPCTEEIILTMPDTDRGLPVAELVKVVEKYNRSYHIAGTVSDALTIARDITGASDLILLTGSLYLVGEARDLLSRRLVSG